MLNKTANTYYRYKMFKYISFIITLLFEIATSPTLQASNNSALIPADEEQHGYKAYQSSTVK
ncbi:hypothetical protein IM40_08095 [Candidatus Paracaedimonas acanthamoebae]|nr:hypothetical protein IM40_08095 [Candidatus Paracaedimonas acanthamoebae]